MRVSGEKIKEVRVERGLTVAALAELLQVKRQQIEHWERNGVPTFRSLERIAKGLGVAPEFLVER